METEKDTQCGERRELDQTIMDIVAMSVFVLTSVLVLLLIDALIRWFVGGP